MLGLCSYCWEVSRSSGAHEVHHRAERRALAALELHDLAGPFRVQRLAQLVERSETLNVVIDQLAEARHRLDGLLVERVVATEDGVEALAQFRLVVETVEGVQVFEVEDVVDQGCVHLVVLGDGVVADLLEIHIGELSLRLTTTVPVLGTLAGLGGHLLALGTQAHRITSRL